MKKHWDDTNRRRKALEHFLDTARRECSKLLNLAIVNPDERQAWSTPWRAMRDLSKIAEWPAGLDFESEGPLTVRDWISGRAGRVWLLENYGLFWRAVRGQGISWTMNQALGYTWEAYRKLRDQERSCSYMLDVTAIVYKAIGPSKKNAFKKLTTLWGVLTDQTTSIAAQIRAELPPIEPPTLDVDEDAA